MARVIGANGETTAYAYTHESTSPYRVIRTVVTNARSHATTHDISNGDVVRVTNPLGHATQYAYDSRHNVTQVTDPLARVTTFAYNAHNKVTQIVQASGSLNLTTTFGWNTTETPPNDNLVSVTNPRGIRTDYTYDSKHNLTSVRRAVGTSDESLTQYDTLDRLTRTTTPDGRFVAYAYDRTGTRTRLTYPDGSTTLTYAYDAANRLTQLTQGTLTWSLSYDPAGNRTAIAQPNGTRTDYAYLTNNWLQSIIHKRPDGATFQSFTYTYDANGNRVSQTDGTGTTTFTLRMGFGS